MAERVLVVDDNMMMRQVLATHLGGLGFSSVSRAINGIDAMNQLLDGFKQNSPFSIVLLDWNMPEMNGFDFLKKCRADKRFDKMAIVMVAAECEQQNIVKALECGATSYLVKPFTPESLEEKLKQVRQWLGTTDTTEKATHA